MPVWLSLILVLTPETEPEEEDTYYEDQAVLEAGLVGSDLIGTNAFTAAQLESSSTNKEEPAESEPEDEKVVIKESKDGSNGKLVLFRLPKMKSVKLSIFLKRIMKLTSKDRIGSRELESTGDIKHWNIISLYGYYTAPDYNLLVYELMPNGSLTSKKLALRSLKIWEDDAAKVRSKPRLERKFHQFHIQVAREFSFDGVDLDWEYPQTQIDIDNFGMLLDECGAAINEEAHSTGNSKLLLSAATYYKPVINWDVVHTYPVKSINNNLDWINAMCYDYHGKWNVTAAGYLAALYDPNGDVSTSDGLQSWINAGI
ncbi:hypothetical protein L1987_29866 [Smallanthus sonchifolius]|uniref:Uncharacterized protein n=1 Tax=Smallanthus sonchifolius TaxID=185202 RepID=A0ACB9I1T9_9ASTR|nr:hypothetical protein L1987_29866 [Smallanthus sonchifolius]